MDVNKYVISSRIRLARNVSGIPFPRKLNDERAYDERAYTVMKDVYDCVCSSGRFRIHKMSALSEVKRTAMMERHLISGDLVKGGECSAVILSEDDAVSIMINEEDHIRAQCIISGLALTEGYKILNEIDDAIADRIKYAFDGELGYLTACPTNLGTGMRASAMMFLPALTLNQYIMSVVNQVNLRNIAVRGVYGEGSGAEGFMYQVSNRCSLGATEEEIIAAVSETVRDIAASEEKAVEQLLKTRKAELTDSVYRAYGLLTNSYKMDSKEFMNLMGQMKLGASLGIIKIKDKAALDEIIIKAQPANLILLADRELTAAERDIFRSEVVGKELLALKATK
ncbi:MAG: protein arginine kinase [Clostridiales bacterium]|jgi:protein arginine kinase|nr:protein arginine kinase [Clostridiales bacterium]